MHNLPLQLTSFVGREAEVAAVESLLESNRLVTLTGSGGVGKTRIALQVAADLAESAAYRDGVWLVELAGLTDPKLVPHAVAWALRIHEAPGRSLEETLLDVLATRQLLLILDNCEHLIDACAALVERLLSTMTDLHVLTTSREPLEVPGEIAWRVPSLSVPDVSILESPDALLSCPSVRLLVERARAVVQSFTLTLGNRAAVSAVCRRLDGIPLAIELAAARLAALSAEQVAERLDDVFHLLTTGGRTAVPRQKTLWATVDWSYELLSESERALFRRCGVFIGGWTLDAAEAVCAGGAIQPGDVLDLTARLVSKSLVLAEEHSETDRYRMLEPIRQFAVEQLGTGDEAIAARDRHLAWLVDLAERAEPGMWGPRQVEWLERLDLEQDNIRAALEWSKATGQSESMLRLATELSRFWDVRGFLTDGYTWLLRALDATPLVRTRTRAHGLTRAGYLAVLRGDVSAAQTHVAEGLRLSEELCDEECIGAALLILGMVARARGDYEQAASRFDESLKMSRQAGHRPGVYTSLHLLASTARARGDHERAESLDQESLALKREHGDAWSEAASLFSLGSLARIRGDDARAAALYRESLGLRWRLQDRVGICVCLEGMAGLEVSRWPVAAATFLGAAARLRELTGRVRRRDAASDDPIDQARSAIGEQAFAAAWQLGRELPLERVVKQALVPESGVPDTPPAAPVRPIEPATGDLRPLVESALRRINNLPALRQHPLLGRTPSTRAIDQTGAEAATLLRGDLLHAIDRLRPSTPRPSPGSTNGAGGWIHYLVLYEAYVEGRTNQEIMRRYYVPGGTFYRERRNAIDAVSEDLARRAVAR